MFYHLIMHTGCNLKCKYCDKDEFIEVVEVDFKALENAIKVLNVKSIEDELKLIKAKFDTRVELRSKKIGSRVQKQKANEKVAKEKKKNDQKKKKIKRLYLVV